MTAFDELGGLTPAARSAACRDRWNGFRVEWHLNLCNVRRRKAIGWYRQTRPRLPIRVFLRATTPMARKRKCSSRFVVPFAPYDGAGHGFLRAGEAPDASEPNKTAREKAWARWKEILAAL
jgi:hypothetical protein